MDSATSTSRTDANKGGIMEEKEIFSGNKSVELWGLINVSEGKHTKEALYLLGCKCQELEDLVRKLMRERK